MAADSLKKKVLSRRSLFTMAGGAAGLLIANKVHPGGLGGATSKGGAQGASGPDSQAKAGGAPGKSGQAQAKAGLRTGGAAGKPGSNRPSPEEEAKLRVSGVPGPGKGPVKASPEAEAMPHGPVITKNEERAFQGAHVDDPGRLATASRPVLELLSPLKPGVKVYGWKVVAIHDVHMGAVPVVLESKNGTRYQVDVLKRDRTAGAPQSVADTSHFSLFLANKGNGRKPSDESLGLGAIALATVLSRRMPKGTPASLLTWRERMSRFPNGDYNVPV